MVIKKDKVLHIFRNLKVGGNQIAALEIICNTNDKFDHKILVVLNDLEMADDFQKANCEIITLSSTKRSEIIRLVKDIIAAGNYRSVVTWFFPFALNFESKDQKFLHHVGTAPVFGLTKKYFIEVLYHYWFFKPKGKIIFASEYIKRTYTRVFRRRFKNATVIPNGVDTIKFSNHKSRPSSQTVTMVGRLDGSKDFDGLIYSAARIKDLLPNLIVNIVGDGPDRVRLTNLASELGLLKTVKFLGTQRDIPAIMQGSDVFVFLNRPVEGFGIVLIEAMSCGLAVVANAVGASMEIIEHNENGLLITSSVELDHALITLLKKPTYAAALGKGARKTVNEKFTIKQMVDRYAQEI